MTNAVTDNAARSRVAATLTSGALDLVPGQGERVQPRCSYVADFIACNAHYQDLLARH